MYPSLEERERIARELGVVKCDNCLQLCPFCPRLLAVRPDLRPVVAPAISPDTEPSFFQKATNFGRAITQHLAAGLPQADEPIVAHRLEVCHVCEHFNVEQTTCKVCGCNMVIKVRWAEQKCPVNKW